MSCFRRRIVKVARVSGSPAGGLARSWADASPTPLCCNELSGHLTRLLSCLGEAGVHFPAIEMSLISRANLLKAGCVISNHLLCQSCRKESFYLVRSPTLEKGTPRRSQGELAVGTRRRWVTRSHVLWGGRWRSPPPKRLPCSSVFPLEPAVPSALIFLGHFAVWFCYLYAHCLLQFCCYLQASSWLRD